MKGKGRRFNPPGRMEAKSRLLYEESFLTLADNILDVLMIFDRDCRHLYVNAFVEMQTGIPREQFIGKTHEELGFPDHLCKLWKNAIQKVFQQKKRHRIEFELPGGIWIDWLLMPELDEKGDVRHVITAARDITDRKKIEEELERRVNERTKELQQSEEKFRSLFEESRDMVYITSPDGKFLDINSAGVQLLGYADKDEALHSNVRDTYLNPEDRIKFQELIKRQGYVKDFELTLVNRKNQALQVMITATAVKDSEGKYSAYRGIIRDITERRKLEQQLFQVQKMESIGTLAGGIAHDFNNILGGIMGYASLMKAKTTEEHPFRQYIETIERATQRAGELISKLLAFAVGGTYHVTPVDLNAIVQETIHIVSRLFDRSVVVEIGLNPDLPTIDADPALIQQVVMNLLVNARDAMPGGGRIIVETRWEEILETGLRPHVEAQKGRYAVLSVSDTGVGIEEEHLQKIFDPFYSTKEKGKGTGLGLAVVYGVVKNHGGFVQVQSRYGSGSCFEAYLPAGDKPLQASPKTDGLMDLKGAERILVIDDEEDIRNLARDAFQEYGYSVVLAADGSEALDIFRVQYREIDLVLLDIIMPKMGGQETLKELKTIDPAVKVILSSGYSQSGHTKEMTDAGVDGFIQKPYQIQQLLALVRNTIDAGEQKRKNE